MITHTYDLNMESVNKEINMSFPESETREEKPDNVNDEHLKEGDETTLTSENKVEERPVATPVTSSTPVSPPAGTPLIQDVVRDCQEIDPVSSKSTSLSEVEEGQILESSSDASDNVLREGLKSNINKRPSSVLSDGSEAGLAKKPKKKISFSAVTAYYFPRAQGFTCIPSQGGSTLGMALKHSHEESFTLNEHAIQQRRNHRR